MFEDCRVESTKHQQCFERKTKSRPSGIPCINVYFNVVLKSGATAWERIATLEKVFCMLKAGDLRFRIKKCRYTLPEVAILGYKNTAAVVDSTLETLRAIVDEPEPLARQAHRYFLWLFAFCNRFLQGAKHSEEAHQVRRSSYELRCEQRSHIVMWRLDL